MHIGAYVVNRTFDEIFRGGFPGVSRKSSLYFAKFTFSEIAYLGNSAIPGCSRPGFTDYKDGEVRLFDCYRL